MKNIRLFAMDVDGTLTDGKLYVGQSGELMKAFSIKDGQGIVLLHKAGIITSIITARESSIVTERARELHITEVWQGVSDKVETLKTLCEKHSIKPEETAYIGDDLGDIGAIEFCGVSFCPSDAASEVQEKVSYVLHKKGGDGAVREAAEWLLSNRNSN